MLYTEEREKYNREIREENDAREDVINANLKEAEELAEKLRQKADEVWRINWNKVAAEQAAQQAEAELAELEIEEAGRKEAIRWGCLTSVEREKELPIQAQKEAAKETYLKWIRQTPQEKKSQIRNLQWLSKTGFYRGEAHGGHLSNAASRLKKATKAKNKGNRKVATFYLLSAEQAQVSAKHCRKAAELYVSGNQAAGAVWGKVAKSVEASGDGLRDAANRLEKGAEAKSAGNPEIAALYLQSAEQEQALAEHYRKAAEAYA
ncbi:MAG TPA: hypothetical protein VJK54_08730 [Chthoniobacterales bacterium]|nr:hypothetical protein [Chthoniobacterales bacterium]